MKGAGHPGEEIEDAGDIRTEEHAGRDQGQRATGKPDRNRSGGTAEYRVAAARA